MCVFWIACLVAFMSLIRIECLVAFVNVFVYFLLVYVIFLCVNAGISLDDGS